MEPEQEQELRASQPIHFKRNSGIHAPKAPCGARLMGLRWGEEWKKNWTTSLARITCADCTLKEIKRLRTQLADAEERLKRQEDQRAAKTEAPPNP